MSDTTGAKPERRLIAIDAETVERLRKAPVQEDVVILDAEAINALRSIIAAYEEGVGIPDPARSQSPTRFLPVWMSEGEAQYCLDLLRESAGNPDIEWPERVVSLFERAVEGESRRTFEQMQAEREIARKLTGPAPQEGKEANHD